VSGITQYTSRFTFSQVLNGQLYILRNCGGPGAGDPFKIEADWSVRPARADLDALAATIRGSLAT
jgi:hypothetical protein